MAQPGDIQKAATLHGDEVSSDRNRLIVPARIRGELRWGSATIVLQTLLNDPGATRREAQAFNPRILVCVGARAGFAPIRCSVARRRGAVGSTVGAADRCWTHPSGGGFAGSRRDQARLRSATGSLRSER